MKGGYKIISLKDNNFTVGGNAIKIDGIYDAIESSYRKPTMLSDIVIENIERSDRFVAFGINNQNFVATVAISADVDVLQCTVTSEDMVTFAEA